MRRGAVCVLLALALCLGLVSCGEREQGLSVMGRRSDMEKSYMRRAFELYESETGNKLELIEIDDAQFEAEAERRFNAGDRPDVFLHFNNADLVRFDPEENFLDLSGESWVGDLTDSALAYCRGTDGALLGMPFWESSVSGCYYNKTILDSLGLGPASTQAEFDMLCDALAGIGRTPILWPGDGCTWMFQFGLDPVFADDPELLVKINSNMTSYGDIPEVLAMAEWISGAAQRGWFGQSFLKTGWDGISPALASGEAVMTFIWDSWFYTDFTPGKYTVDDFALMPVFMGTESEGTYEGGNLNMMMVNRDSERLDEALAFLSFCASPETLNDAFAGVSTVPCFKSQTAGVVSGMVLDASESLAAHERASTTASKVAGYSADDVWSAFDDLLRGRLTPAQCVRRMDELRVKEAASHGIEGFEN